MSFFQEDGVLTSRTDAGTDVITLSGAGAALDVKLVRLVLNGATGTGGANANFIYCVGMSNGTNHRSISNTSQDNVTTSTSRRIMNESFVLKVITPAGTVTDQATISVVGNGTFTINWTVKNGTAYQIGWTALGGTDITDTEFGTDSIPTSTGQQDITTTIKSADMGFFFSVWHGATDTSAAHAIACVGMADSSGDGGVAATTSQNGVGTSNTHRYQSASACVAIVFNGSKTAEGNLVAFDSINGLQINWTTVNAFSGKFFYVLVKGGRWEVGNGTTNTSASTKAFTTTFQPVGLSVVSACNTTSASVVAENRITFGSTDGTSQYSVSAVDNDALSTTETGTDHQTAYALTTIGAANTSAAPTISGKGKFDSFNALDFMLDWTDDVDAAANEFIWLVCAGDEAVGGGGGMLKDIFDNDIV